MIGTFDFPRGASLRRAAEAIAPRIAGLKARVKSGGGICVYANDNFADWSTSPDTLLHLAQRSGGARILESIPPETDDPVLLKPRHSAFHQTPLEHLLRQAHVTRVLIVGVSTEACVLATALDARVRELDAHVVSDCVASSSASRRMHALTVMRHCEIPTTGAARALTPRDA